jgi:hypothetical protein
VPLPRPDALQPYQASVDSNHNVWTNIMNRDEVMKFDVRTSQWTEYPVPTLGAEMRYFSILEHNGSMQLIMPYSRTRKVARMTFRTQEDMQALKKQVQQQEQARVQYRREWDRHSCLSSETSPPNTRTGRSACPTKTRTRSWYPSPSQEISYHEVGAHHSGRDCAVVYAVAGW